MNGVRGVNGANEEALSLPPPKMNGVDGVKVEGKCAIEEALLPSPPPPVPVDVVQLLTNHAKVNQTNTDGYFCHYHALKRNDYAEDPLLYACGVSVTNTFTQVEGRVLSAPRLVEFGRGYRWKRDDEQITESSESNSANQDEIISLFRRIQSSISKEESTTRKESPKSSEENTSAESVLEVMRQSRKQMKANTLNERGKKVLSIRRGQWKNDNMTDDHPAVPDFNLTRPPSNFVKRSIFLSKYSI